MTKELKSVVELSSSDKEFIKMLISKDNGNGVTIMTDEINKYLSNKDDFDDEIYRLMTTLRDSRVEYTDEDNTMNSYNILSFYIIKPNSKGIICKLNNEVVDMLKEIL